MKSVLSILGVLLVLGVASVSAYHMTEGAGDAMTVSDRNMMNCDVNPYDSVDTCADQQVTADRQTVTNSQLISDRQTVSDTSDTWLVLQCRVTEDTQNTGVLNADDMEMLECYVVDESSTQTVSDRQTVNDRQRVSNTGITTTGTSFSDQWDYNNPNRDSTMTTEGSGQRMDSDATRGFESPVVYQNTLDTSRTSEEQAD